MTSSIAHEVASRGGAIRRARTMAGSLAARLFALDPDSYASERVWPSPKYREAPVLFFREVLGVEPWFRQVQLLELVRDHPRVAVAAGHKVSKSNSIAGLALWFFCSFEEARVVLSSTTSRQVDQILWRELRMMRARAKVPIDGDMHELARSGFKSLDFREVVGFTARESEAVAGISGKNVLYIIDEASGVPDAIFEAIEGNRAGGARVLLVGNPTRTEGEHFEAFGAKARFYATLRISSEESPNVTEGRIVIPGLATQEWVNEKREEWGEESPLYKIRVKGEHVLVEGKRIVSVAAITEAEQRWEEAPEDGRLFIGLDPAGPGEAGDETAAVVRRGKKALRVVAWRGLTEDGIVTNVLGLLLEHKEKREQPVVVLDALGTIGASVHGKLKVAAEQHGNTFEVFGVRVSDKACREPQFYERVRDELWANLARWLREGGAIPEDTKLAKELNIPEWIGQLSGKLKATDKRAIRKLIGRSPDRADALALSVWEPMALMPYDQGQSPEAPSRSAEPPREAFDPYGAGDPFDPYGR